MNNKKKSVFTTKGMGNNITEELNKHQKETVTQSFFLNLGSWISLIFFETIRFVKGFYDYLYLAIKKDPKPATLMVLAWIVFIIIQAFRLVWHVITTMITNI